MRYGRIDVFQRISVFVALGVLILYYFSLVGSMVFSAVGNDTAAFYSAPYLEQTAKQMIARVEDKNGEHTKMIAWFHAMNPDMLFRLAHPNDKNLLKNAVLFDPQNDEYRREWLDWLIDKEMANDVSEQIKWFAQEMTIENNARQVKLIDFASSSFFSIYKENKLLILTTTPLAYAKLFYIMGLEVLSSKPVTTKLLWTISKDLVPNWGYFSVELASLEHSVFHNEQNVQMILRECASNNYAKDYCEYVIKFGTPPIGSQKYKIQKIKI